MRDLAAHADRGDAWESVWVYDHFHTVPAPSHDATHEAWTLMAALAVATSRVRLGQMCTCMGYRNPAYLAKVAATVDIISGGRTEMSIGGGWYEHEWRAYGYGFPSAGVRLARLDEGVQIMRDAWRDGRVTFEGRQYQVDDAIVAPKPLQQDGIPLWIAGGGEKVTLKIAAKYAQYTNFSADPDEFARKSEILAGHCRDAGTDYNAIVRSANVNAVLGTSDTDVEQRLSRIRDRLAGICGDAAADAMIGMNRAPGNATGTPEKVIRTLTDLRALGCEYVICYFPEAAYDRSGIELFEREVIPALAASKSD
jgi:F420-dependent oxidoreductase-like protein